MEKALFPKVNTKNMSKSELAGLVVGILFAYAIFVFMMAFFTNYALHRFGANWSDFWGWSAIYAVSPVIRMWVSNRAN